MPITPQNELRVHEPQATQIIQKTVEQPRKPIGERASKLLSRFTGWIKGGNPDPDTALQKIATFSLEGTEDTVSTRILKFDQKKLEDNKESIRVLPEDISQKHSSPKAQALKEGQEVVKGDEPTEDEVKRKLDKLPSLEDFPEKARIILANWITQVIDARQDGKPLDKKLLQEITKVVKENDFGGDPLFVWGCKEMYLAAKGPMFNRDGRFLNSVDLGIPEPYLLNSGKSLEEKLIEKGEDVVVHSTDLLTLLDILRQNELSCRDKQINPRFKTGELKTADREKYDVSFAWNAHNGRYGNYALVLPTDLALKDAAFCEIDGMHIVNKNYTEGYTYNLDQPYVVVAQRSQGFFGLEESQDELLRRLLGSLAMEDEWYRKNPFPKGLTEDQNREYSKKLKIGIALSILGWSKDQTDKWIQRNFLPQKDLNDQQLENRANQLTGILSLVQLGWQPEAAQNWVNQHMQSVEGLNQKQKEELYSKLNFNLRLISLGWLPEKADEWVETHLVIGDQFDENENTNLESAIPLNHVYWDFYRSHISPLKQRVLDRFKEQGYLPSPGKKIFPTGEQINLGTRDNFWTYELKSTEEKTVRQNALTSIAA